ncbi:MAG: cobalamin-dependent protein [Candidatus Omnitrophota bacterium]
MQENKRVDLVNFASFFRKVEDISRPPTGLLYVGSALKNHNYDVRIRHIMTKDSNDALERILERNPLFVGFSSFTGPAIKNTITLMRRLKEKSPSVKIVWGGVHPSILPVQCLEEESVDFVCIGEGEETIIELAQNINNLDSFVSVKEIGFKNN